MTGKQETWGERQQRLLQRVERLAAGVVAALPDDTTRIGFTCQGYGDEGAGELVAVEPPLGLEAQERVRVPRPEKGRADEHMPLAHALSDLAWCCMEAAPGERPDIVNNDGGRQSLSLSRHGKGAWDLTSSAQTRSYAPVGTVLRETPADAELLDAVRELRTASAAQWEMFCAGGALDAGLDAQTGGHNPLQPRRGDDWKGAAGRHSGWGTADRRRAGGGVRTAGHAQRRLPSLDARRKRSGDAGDAADRQAPSEGVWGVHGLLPRPARRPLTQSLRPRADAGERGDGRR